MFPGFYLWLSECSLRFNFRCDQLIAFSVNIDNLDRIIFFQVLTQLRNIHIHTTGIEVVIINPDSLQSKVTLQNFISVRTKQSEKFRFFGSQLRLLAFCSQNLFLSIESKLTDLVDIAFFVLLS